MAKNKIRVKYQDGWSYDNFEYQNYGSSITREQKRTCFAQWNWCIKNL